MKLKTRTVVFYTIMIVATTIIKVICAPRLELSGTTGIMAVALFAGFVGMDTKKAFLLPIITLLASNIIIEIFFRLKMFPFAGFYKWEFVEYILIGFLLTAIALRLNEFKTTGVVASIITGPTVFFIISNFVVWLGARHSVNFGYTNDFKGVINCYIAGLPFYRNSLLSTAVLLPVFIAAHQWFVKGKAELRLAK